MKRIKHIIRETNDIIEMMNETLFGHRVTTYSQKDTNRLHNKIKEPWTDKEREDHMNTVEPLMTTRQFVMPGKDTSLEKYLDIDTRISRADYLSDVEDDDEDDTDINSQFKNIDISNLK